MVERHRLQDLPAAGVNLVELILDGAPFRLERFAEGQLLEDEYGYGHIWK